MTEQQDQATATPESSGDAGRGRPAGQSLARNAGSLLASQGITWTLAVVLTAVQPRLLGPEGVGQLQLAMSLWAIAGAFVIFGTSNLVTVSLARRTDDVQLARSAMALQILTYLVSSLAVITFSLVAGYRQQLLAVVLIVGCTPLLTVAANVGRATMYGLERMTWPSKVDVINKIVSTAVVLAVLFAGGRVIVIALLGCASAALQSVLMLRGLHREAGVSLRPSFRGVFAVARRAYPFLLIEAAVTAYQQIDTVILSLLVDQVQLGWYAVADQLMGTLIVVPTLLMTALFPRLARLAHGDPDGARAYVRTGLRVMCFAGTAVGVGILIVSGQLTRLLFGDEFSGSGAVLAVRALAMIVMYQTITIGNYMMAADRLHRWTSITVIAILVSVPLNLVLVPMTERIYGNGAIGGALVYVVSETVILLGATALAGMRFYDRHVLAAATKAAIAAGAMIGATWWARDRFILLPVLIGACTYIVALWLLRAANADERNMLRQAFGRITARFGA